MKAINQAITSSNWKLKKFLASESSYVERLKHLISEVSSKIQSMGGGAIPLYVERLYME